jgi:hypothetical protein
MPPAPNTTKANACDRRQKARKDGNPAGALAADLDRQRALELRKEGLSYRGIARELRVSISTAYDYVNDGWGRILDATDETRETLRAIEEENLDAMLARALPIATKDNLTVVDVEYGPDGPVEVRKDAAELQLKAMARVLQISQRQAQLRGLDAPTKVEGSVSGSALEPLEVLAARVAEAKAKSAQQNG